MAITLKDIARKTGYGYGTVARALSDAPKLINEKTCTKILKVAKAFGYIKNLQAKALVSKKTNDIGLFIPARFVSVYYNDFYVKMLLGCSNAAEKYRYRLRIVLLKDENTFSEMIQDIFSMNLAGIILGPYWENFYPDQKLLAKIKIPVVMVDNINISKIAFQIQLDNFKGGQKGTDYLIKKGHKRIAVIRGFRKDIEDRFKGYKYALGCYGISADKELIKKGDAKEGTGYSNTMELLELKKNKRPTAIFCLDDEMAIGAMRAIRENALNCPEDIAVLGHDGIDAGELLNPPLTTVSRPVAKMVFHAVELIVDRKNRPERKRIIVEPELVIRKSCGE